MSQNQTAVSRGRRRPPGVLLLAAACAGACARSAPQQGPVRLVDVYRPDAVEGRAPAASPRPSFEWRFAAPAPAPRPGASPPAPVWQVGAGVATPGVREGRLVGRALTSLPIVALSRPPSADRDVVQEIHVRVRASAGTQL